MLLAVVGWWLQAEVLLFTECKDENDKIVERLWRFQGW